MKMEEKESSNSTLGEEIMGTGKTLSVLQAGSLKGILEKSPGDQVKQESDGGSLERWEVQLQEFLKTVESPHSEWGAAQLPEKPRPWDDTKAFLASFEQVAEACQWPREEWAARLLPALRGEAERAFSRLGARDREDYGKVKAAILRGDALRREMQRQHFRRFCYREAEGPRGAYGQLQELCSQWLKVEKHSKEQILELLILEQLLTVLPPEIQSRVRECGPETCAQAVTLAEDFLQLQQDAERKEKQMPAPFEEQAAVSFSAAERGLSDTDQRPLSTDIKQERDEEEASLLGEERMSVDREAKNSPEDSVRAGLYGTPAVRRQDEDDNAGRHRPECQTPSHSGGREDDSVTGVGNDKDLRKNTTCQRIHTGKRQSPYNVGRKSFSLSSGLDKHKKTHATENPHKCLACGKCFVYSSNLVQHQRTHTGEKPFECSVCGKRFSTNSDCSRHERIHTGEKPYKCSECGKRFRLASDLSRHRRIHTGEKLYECLDCKKRFTQKANLDTHCRKIHTGNKPYRRSQKHLMGFSES
ncbi:zinc finger protein 165-like isoform X2 [Rhineura floridana]|uniref:zinc finger protein 165-like isoform X2 n=1 Tax=Rhineura floridana TaxID=261503 RepID=UPI002AC7FAA9|nr:zinc finger protein 165-like isoform X2 [Rhineura floridana]